MVERKDVPALDVAEAEGYALERETRVRYEAVLAGPAHVQAMLAMTPHVHRMSPQGREAIAQLERLTVTVDVVFRLLQVRAGLPA